MRRFAAIAVVSIGAVFLGSLLILDRLDAAEDHTPAPRTPVELPELPPAPTSEPVTRTPAPPPEVVRQLASPPPDPAPPPLPDALPPSGVPPAPAYVRQQLETLEREVTSRCGRMTLQLGDQLRREGRSPGGHAVLLLDVEPMEGSVKIWNATIQAPGSTRPALVACAQHTLRGHTFSVGALRPGERIKVQVVVGMRE